MKMMIEVRVEMHDDKGRTKALKVVAMIKGVESIKIKGKEKDKLVVVGDGVDPVKVTTSLRKIGHAEILSVTEVKKIDEERMKMCEAMSASQYFNGYPHITPYNGYRPVTPYKVIQDSSSDTCSIM